MVSILDIKILSFHKTYKNSQLLFIISPKEGKIRKNTLKKDKRGL
jgi:hypothetical protein